MKQTEFLMCLPTYIRSHSINPKYNRYMDIKNQPDVAMAMMEVVGIFHRAVRAGAVGHLIEPVKGLGDMVFAANGFWGRGGEHVFVMSNHAPEHRRAERKHYASWLVRHGYGVLFLTPEEEGEEFEKLFFAGQGMVVTTEKQYFIGCGPRTTPQAIDRIEKELRIDREVVRINLPGDGSFYDLDVILHYSREADELLFYPGALDKEGIWAIEHAKVRRVTALPRLSSAMQFIPEENSYNFTLNAPYIGNVEIFPRRGPVSSLPKQIRELEKHGRYRNIELTTIHLPQLGKLGGGARCPIGFLN